MLIKRVKADWLFINKVDDNGNYRVTFTVDKDLDKEIIKILEQVAQENNSTLGECAWQGSRKEENGVITYTAKCSKEFTNKKGETIIRELPVYNEKAQRIPSEDLVNVANGATISLTVEPYWAKHKNKKGAMLGLRSLQLLKFQAYEGENPYEDESGENPYSEDNDKSMDKNKVQNNNDDIFE